MTEMYVQGVPPRNVTEITERLCGTEISFTQVCKAATSLDDVLENWRKRPLNTLLPDSGPLKMCLR